MHANKDIWNIQHKRYSKTQWHRCFLQYFLYTCINTIFAISMVNICWKKDGYYLYHKTLFTNTIVICKTISLTHKCHLKQYWFFIANTALIIFIKHFATYLLIHLFSMPAYGVLKWKPTYIKCIYHWAHTLSLLAKTFANKKFTWYKQSFTCRSQWR